MPVLAHDVYTDQPGSGPYVIFPTHGHQILSNCTHIIGVSVLAFLFARRTDNDRFTSWIWWSNLSWARLLIILIFLDSWIFLAFSGIVVNGVGLSYSTPVCSLGIFGCIFFYATSKGLTYLFLVERVWVVCSAGKSVTRTESLIYRGCALVVFGYTAIFIDMIIGRVAQIRDDGVCLIGLHSYATIPLLTYDLFINIFLTSMFLWFLCREQSISERLRRLARRTAFAAAIALTISCVNILILALLHGKQLGWVCLSSCAADVTVNALVLFWATGGASREPHWHGAFEDKDGVRYAAEPRELPPLNFPVSFVAQVDPEMGATIVENGLGTQQQQNQKRKSGNGARFVSLAESISMREKEFCEGSSKDGLSGHGHGHGHEQQQRRKRASAKVDLSDDEYEDDEYDEEDDKKSGVMESKDIEWDITDSASSHKTHFGLANADSEDDDKRLESDPNRQSWRLTLDLELQRPPQLLSPAEHTEPDSPATHETAESRTRLTHSTHSSHSPDLNSTLTLESPTQKRKNKNEPKKQRRKEWSARARALRRPNPSHPSRSQTLQRPASEPTDSDSQHQQPRPNPPHPPRPLSDGTTTTTSNAEPSHLPLHLPSLSLPLPSHIPPTVPPPKTKRRGVLRSHSDSLMRMRFSDLTRSSMGMGMSMIPGRPRLSQ